MDYYFRSISTLFYNNVHMCISVLQYVYFPSQIYFYDLSKNYIHYCTTTWVRRRWPRNTYAFHFYLSVFPMFLYTYLWRHLNVEYKTNGNKSIPLIWPTYCFGAFSISNKKVFLFQIIQFSLFSTNDTSILTQSTIIIN